jgi:hypothetical protein
VLPAAQFVTLKLLELQQQQLQLQPQNIFSFP